MVPSQGLAALRGLGRALIKHRFTNGLPRVWEGPETECTSVSMCVFLGMRICLFCLILKGVRDPAQMVTSLGR